MSRPATATRIGSDFMSLSRRRSLLGAYPKLTWLTTQEPPMTTPTDPTQLPYADLPDLREVFVDQARMTVVDGYCVKIELAVARPRLIGPNQSQMTLYPC